jgi:alpha-L-fucosidase
MDRYAYLLSLDEIFFVKEHQDSPQVQALIATCEKIVDLEEQLDALRDTMAVQSQEMFRRRRRVRRDV